VQWSWRDPWRKATIDDENVIRRFVPFLMSAFATKANKWIDVSVRQLCANSGHWRVLLDYLVRAEQKDFRWVSPSAIAVLEQAAKSHCCDLILIVYAGLSWNPGTYVCVRLFSLSALNSFRLFDQNVTAITDCSSVPLLEAAFTRPGIRRETMRRKPLAFVFGIVLAMAVLGITTWAAVPKHESAAPAAKGTVYRPDLWKVY
jgi:hypothetical protein